MRGLLLLLIVPLAGCQTKEQKALNAEYEKLNLERSRMWAEADRRAVDACLKRGHIPVRSEWNGRMVECR